MEIKKKIPPLRKEIGLVLHILLHLISHSPDLFTIPTFIISPKIIHPLSLMNFRILSGSQFGSIIERLELRDGVCGIGHLLLLLL